MKRIAIIGSGPAGLAAAAILSRKGHNTTVYEANNTYGGKLGILKLGQSYFDTGPSLLTEPNVIDDVYTQFGVDPRKYWQYKVLDKGTKYFWQDGTELQLYGVNQEVAGILATALGVDKQRLNKYLNKNYKIYKDVAPDFLDREPSFLQMANPTKLSKVYKTLPYLLTSANSMNNKYLSNKKAVQLFNRFATYSGSNPYKGPALLNIAGAPELFMGNYYPMGGMRSVATGLYNFALDSGAQFRFNSKVEKITKNGNRFNVFVNQGSIKCDSVIYGGDYSALDKLLDKNVPKKYFSRGKSTSGVVFFWQVKGSYNNLKLHNILFSGDYKNEFEYLSRREVYEDPTIYINITSKIEQSLAKKGHENWFVMINVPAGYEANINKLRKIAKRKIANQIGDFKITAEDYLTPRIIESYTGSIMGAIYGHDSNSIMSAIKKPKLKHRAIKGLYCIGGSVHPGGGVPLSIRSAKIVARDL